MSQPPPFHQPVIDPENRAKIHDLLIRIKNSDLTAWAELFEIEAAILRRFILSKFDELSIEDNDDIVQEVLLKILNNIHAYRGVSEGEAIRWIRSITHHECIDLYRRNRWPVVELDESKPDKHQQKPEEVGEDDLTDARLIKLLPQLTRNEIRVLRYIAAGYKNHEMALAMGVSKARVTQIIKSIKKKAAGFNRVALL